MKYPSFANQESRDLSNAESWKVGKSENRDLEEPESPDSAYPMSYRQVAAVLGISHVRVRLIEKRALDKLRRGLVRLGVRPRDLRLNA